LVLAYIGGKMIIAEGLLGLDPLHIPIGISLAVVAGLITGSMVISLLLPPTVGHQELLDNTDAASLIADIDPHASLSSAIELSRVEAIDPSITEGAVEGDSGLLEVPSDPDESPKM
jgi:hypothetical protein